ALIEVIRVADAVELDAAVAAPRVDGAHDALELALIVAAGAVDDVADAAAAAGAEQQRGSQRGEDAGGGTGCHGVWLLRCGLAKQPVPHVTAGCMPPHLRAAHRARS